MTESRQLRDGKPLAEFRQVLPRRPTIIEIGAHDGSTTEGFRLLFPRARIVAFEPEPRAIAKFKARPLLKGIQLVECAVGAQTGTANFYRSGGWPSEYAGIDDWDASGSIRTPAAVTVSHPWLRFDEQITVPITRLDDEIERQRIDLIDLIWADVQGAEEDLIRGAPNALRRTRYFYTEYADREEYRGQITLSDICDLLADFEVVELFTYDVLFRNKNIPGSGLWRRWW
jgi:FkbM family methyltransferase